MPDDPRLPKSPLKALADRWWIAAALVVLGGAGGAGLATLTPTTYTGEARVAVGSESLDARLVAGYSQASTQLAADVARYVNDAQARAALEPVMGAAADDVSQIAASPIPTSSVVRIEVRAGTPQAAADAAQAVAQQLSDQVNAVSGETSESLLTQYTDLSNRVAAAQEAEEVARGNLASLIGAEADQAEIDAARGAVEQATANVAVLEVQQQALGTRYRNSVTNTPAAAGLRVVREGELVGSDASSTMQKFGLAGAVLGLLLALVLAVGLDRRRAARARRDEPVPLPGGGERTGGLDDVGAPRAQESQASRS
ncbi:hypothetical protein [Kineococcus sp. SYSU DK001]|uniref:hypothetical protein n=1 Tax=Kineococcus sp. SYSU DK001 TaxID=3383122 RepID=UPI003D7DA8D8